ncbi:oxidoreductase [Pseudomonas sp. EL_65y_Pfl2_R95]|uniref:oxidoreductase n=1 Tax=Pseudomonas sp. EL_65y_Pfl2_R95 TaxID=3088698 RepID=UPI0030D9FDD4
MRTAWLITCSFMLFCLTVPDSAVASAAYPPNRPALSVELGDGHSVSLTLSELETMPKRMLTTLEPNEQEAVEWTGVDLNYLLTQLNISPESYTSLRLEALNSYSVIIPRQDIQQFRPIIAYLRNGKSMPVSEYGPLYLIYPFNEFPELNVQLYYNRSIWQLSKISLKTE